MCVCVCVGWFMQLAQHVCVHRKWALDKDCIIKALQYFRESHQPTQLFFCPEGTILSENNKQKDRTFAEKNGLKVYEHLLHPHTTGFVNCVQQMSREGRAVAVCDLTIGFLGPTPKYHRDLLAGNPVSCSSCALQPSLAHFLYRQLAFWGSLPCQAHSSWSIAYWRGAGGVGRMAEVSMGWEGKAPQWLLWDQFFPWSWAERWQTCAAEDGRKCPVLDWGSGCFFLWASGCILLLVVYNADDCCVCMCRPAIRWLGQHSTVDSWELLFSLGA